jgi:WD40 repeat protein
MLGLRDEKVIIWDVSTGQALRTLSGAQPGRKIKAGYPNAVLSLAFSPEGKLLATASHDNLIKLWDVTTGREVRALAGHIKSVKAVAFSADGRQLVSDGYDDTVRVWDVSTGRELSHYQSKGFSHFEAVAFTPDGRAVAVGWQPDGLKLLDVSNGRELFTFGESKYFGGGKSAAISFDVKTLAVADYYEDGTKLWNFTTGALRATLKGHTNDVYAIAFSPDGKLILTGSKDAIAKLWDAATGTELASLVAIDQDDWMVAGL